jgi:hypothetical protein
VGAFISSKRRNLMWGCSDSSFTKAKLMKLNILRKYTPLPYRFFDELTQPKL